MLSILLAASVLASDWPAFRGPTGQGETDADPPVEWSATQNVVWRTELPGRGHSSPVLAADAAWVTAAQEDGSAMRLLAVDLPSGRLRHEVELFSPADVRRIHAGNTYASPTPVTDGRRVFAHFGRYGTAAVEAATGEVLWRNDTLKVVHDGGPGSSPVLAGGVLFLTLDGADESYVCGLDPDTGGVLWKTPRSAPMRANTITHRAFSTPLVLRRGGAEFVVSPGPDQIHCYDPKTGQSLWHVRYTGFSTVPCPAADESRLYFCTGFFDPELWAVSLDGLLDGEPHGDVTESHVAWRFSGPVSDTPSPTLSESHVWIVSDKGVLTCVDKETGERTTARRVRDNVDASPLLTAGGRLYVCGKSGATTVWDVRDPASPEKLATNRLDGDVHASPAVVGDDLLIRTQSALYRIGRR